MKLRLGTLRLLVREALGLDEEAWMPGHFYPGAEPLSAEDADRINSKLGQREGDLDEVDTDPSNNPGRPDDAAEYLGMHPAPTAAMSHPFAGGAGGGEGGGADPSEPPDEPEEGT